MSHPIAPPIVLHMLHDKGETDTGLAFDGFTPHFDETCNRRVPLDFNLPGEPAIIYSRVAGVSKRYATLQLDCFRFAKRLSLIPEPTNPADEKAIMVTCEPHGKEHHIGYLPSEVAAAVPNVARGGIGAAVIVQVFTKDKQRVGIRIVGSLGRPVEARPVRREV